MEYIRQHYFNLGGEIRIMKDLNLKPNFSELARKYNIDRHIVSKMYKSDGHVEAKERAKRKSFYDQYFEQIKERFQNTANTKMGIYMWLKNTYPNEKHNYNTFKSYTLKQGLEIKKTDKTAHVRYETAPGDQLQLDWKEDVLIHTKSGEEIKFNVLNGTLGYSRFHTFVYCRNRTTEELLRGVFDIYNQLGGCTKRITTDNMSCIVSINNGTKHKHNIITQFEKDSGIKIHLCKVRTPQTKGKVESSMRFINWINAYDGKITDENELIEILKKIEVDCNQQINQTTNIQPYYLFQQEKEHLSPFNTNLLASYINNCETKKVDATLLVTYKGCKYSVPKEYIGESVKIQPINDSLYIYDTTKLIAIHKITNNNINYDEAHYMDGLASALKANDKDIEEMAKNNLNLLSQIGKEK